MARETLDSEGLKSRVDYNVEFKSESQAVKRFDSVFGGKWEFGKHMIRKTFGAKIFGWWKFSNPFGELRVKNTMYLSMMLVYRTRQDGAEGKREGEAETEAERDEGGGSDSYLPLFLS